MVSQEIKDVIYDKLTYKISQVLSSKVLQDFLYDLDVAVDYVGENMVITFSKAIFTNTEVVESSELYSKSWWEHFKKDHMPKWFLAKFPV